MYNIPRVGGNMADEIRLLVADDHEVMRYSISALLDRCEGFSIVAQAGNGRDAVKLALELNPDVCLMDIGMPGLNGVQATRQIVSNGTGVKVIALSMHSDVATIRKMLRAGASAYLLKECAFEELVEAVVVVVAGGEYLSRDIRELVERDAYGDNLDCSDVLTVRETEVLQLIAEGLSSKEVGERLGTSPHTVETHRKQIKKKLGIHRAVELTRYAIKEGITFV